MALTSASTTDAAFAQYENAANYESTGIADCRLFIEACRFLLSPRRTVKRSAAGGRGGSEVELDQTLIAAELEAARQWLATALATLADGGGVIHPDFTDFRV